MGRVLDELAGRLGRAADAHGIVLWFDAEQEYQAVLAQLRDHEALTGTTVLAYDGSYLALRHAAEPFLNTGFGVAAAPASRLICYVPAALGETHDALAEISALGVVMMPGANARSLNSRLHLVAKAALTPVVPAARLDEILRGVQSGSLTFADLEELGEIPDSSVLGLLFGTGNAADIALRFLSDPERDAAIQDKAALPLLAGLLQAAFGLPEGSDDAPGVLRAALEQYLLGAEYVLRLDQAAPTAFAGLARPRTEAERIATRETVSRWRSDARQHAAYAAAADRVQDRLRIADYPVLDLDRLHGLETFRIVERWRQAAVAQALTDGRHEMATAVAGRFKHGFWTNATPVTERTVRWRLLETIARLYRVSSRIEASLAANPSAAEIARRYIAADAPWCELDEAQRRLEADVGLFDPAPPVAPGGANRDELEVLVDQARARYREAANAMAERFTRSLLADGFNLADLPRQRALFATVVQPASAPAKTAYVIVDALRYEMVRSMLDQGFAGWRATLSAAMGTIPTLTPVGMAALMPDANRGIALALKAGSLLPTVGDDTILKDRAARVSYLKQTLAGEVAAVKLDDLTPASARIRQDLAKADFIVVTSTEIDEAGENVGSGHARIVMDAVLDDLRRAVNTLRDIGHSAGAGSPIARIVVVADHGFIFDRDIREGEKIDPPGGGAHRRIWIGHGGTDRPAFARFRASDVDLGGDLEFAAPWNLSVFRTSGGTAYMHGGLSPQELIIPVLVLARVDRAPAQVEAKVEWTIAVPRDRITNRLFFATVQGATAEMLPAPEQVRVKLEVRAGPSVVSEMRTATGPFDESTRVATIGRDPEHAQQMAATQIALMMTGDAPPPETVSLHLLDADTGVELATLADVPCSVL